VAINNPAPPEIAQFIHFTVLGIGLVNDPIKTAIARTIMFCGNDQPKEAVFISTRAIPRRWQGLAIGMGMKTSDNPLALVSRRAMAINQRLGINLKRFLGIFCNIAGKYHPVDPVWGLGGSNQQTTGFPWPFKGTKITDFLVDVCTKHYVELIKTV
jgi:hypothetical protein